MKIGSDGQLGSGDVRTANGIETTFDNRQRSFEIPCLDVCIFQSRTNSRMGLIDVESLQQYLNPPWHIIQLFEVYHPGAKKKVYDFCLISRDLCAIFQEFGQIFIVFCFFRSFTDVVECL